MSRSKLSRHPSTICAEARPAPRSVTEPLVPLPSLSAVHCFEGLDQVEQIYNREFEGFVYARDGHPNGQYLAEKLADLEEAPHALTCSSGMAATSAILLSELNAGAHVALSEQLYGKTTTLIERELSRFGVRSSRFDSTEPKSLQGILTDATRLVFVESISNPLLRLTDLAQISAILEQSSARLIVDNTFAPLLCKPIVLGADLVVHSGTKLIGGHSDLTLGLIAGNSETIDRIGRVASTFGFLSNPFESWLANRGLATLPIRLERACKSAQWLSERLDDHPGVHRVHYPGLPEHPDHQLASRMLAGGFGNMVTIDLGSRETADQLIQSLQMIPFAPSLGDVSTTLSYPWATSHRGQPLDLLESVGVTPGLVRFSVGLEDPADLWHDLSQGLDSVLASKVSSKV